MCAGDDRWRSLRREEVIGAVPAGSAPRPRGAAASVAAGSSSELNGGKNRLAGRRVPEPPLPSADQVLGGGWSASPAVPGRLHERLGFGEQESHLEPVSPPRQHAEG